MMMTHDSRPTIKSVQRGKVVRNLGQQHMAQSHV